MKRVCPRPPLGAREALLERLERSTELMAHYCESAPERQYVLRAEIEHRLQADASELARAGYVRVAALILAMRNQCGPAGTPA